MVVLPMMPGAKLGKGTLRAQLADLFSAGDLACPCSWPKNSVSCGCARSPASSACVTLTTTNCTQMPGDAGSGLPLLSSFSLLPSLPGET